MSSDAEIWRTARDLINERGEKRAEQFAKAQVDEMFETGNFVGHLLWRRILKAVRGVSKAAQPTAASTPKPPAANPAGTATSLAAGPRVVRRVTTLRVSRLSGRSR